MKKGFAIAFFFMIMTFSAAIIPVSADISLLAARHPQSAIGYSISAFGATEKQVTAWHAHTTFEQAIALAARMVEHPK